MIQGTRCDDYTPNSEEKLSPFDNLQNGACLNGVFSALTATVSPQAQFHHIPNSWQNRIQETF
jgi:hypothetical protein